MRYAMRTKIRIDSVQLKTICYDTDLIGKKKKWEFYVGRQCKLRVMQPVQLTKGIRWADGSILAFVINMSALQLGSA